jgi:hypothetical protein
MVQSNDSYEEQTRRLLAETKSELTAIGNQMAELKQKWEALKKEAEAYEMVLQGYLRRTGREVDTATDWVQSLGGLSSHKERLIAIAKHEGGRVRVSHASDLLYTNGFIKSKKRANAYRIVQNILSSMADEGIFEKVNPGEYKLIGAQQSLPGVS